jgi:hypothetical protein
MDRSQDCGLLAVTDVLEIREKVEAREFNV